MNRFLGIVLATVVALAGLSVVFGTWYTIDQGMRGVILRNGALVGVAQPGLGFKIPFIQDVVRYEDRILGLPTQPIEVTPADDRRLVVEQFPEDVAVIDEIDVANWLVNRPEQFGQRQILGAFEAARSATAWTPKFVA